VDGRQLCALKKIQKSLIDDSKMIQHILNEKQVLQLVRKQDFCVQLRHTFQDNEFVCFVFELIEGLSLTQVLIN